MHGRRSSAAISDVLAEEMDTRGEPGLTVPEMSPEVIQSQVQARDIAVSPSDVVEYWGL